VKPDIHPKYYEAKVHCGSCGREWTVGSTRPELRVDVCSNCHPFFTGTQNIIDTAGQVERTTLRPPLTSKSSSLVQLARIGSRARAGNKRRIKGRILSGPTKAGTHRKRLSPEQAIA